jgi:Ca-activated chloride channel family protein
VVYPGDDEFVFDYPFAVLTDDPVRRGAAELLFRTLRDEPAQAMLSDAGFRTPAGAGSNGEASPDSRAFAEVPDPDRVEAAQAAYHSVLRPSRLLTLMDVSGSMTRPVPGAHGATRLQLAIEAAINGLASYPDDTVVGMWAFATDLTATTDYRELAPLEPLGRGPDGVSGRERLAQALAHVSVPERPHRTGLYDSVLAAVREVQRTWDPDRVNSVVVITDGADSDRVGISLPKLLQTLRREHEATKPVAVYSIAYGRHGDPGSLRRISQATEGKSYVAPDPRLIGEVLRDAVGTRACSSDC